MGFGMRKEVYTRKPKEAFKRVKRHVKPRTGKNVNDEKPSTETYYHTYTKPAYQRWWFRLMMMAVAALSVILYMDDQVWSKERALEKEQLFDQEGIFEYYDTHASAFDSVAQYLNEKQGRINYVSPSGGEVSIKILSENYAGSDRPAYNHNHWEFVTPQTLDEVVEGQLLVTRYGVRKVYKKWSYTFHIKNVKQVNTTFLDYLETDVWQLNEILLKVAKQRFSAIYYDYGIVIRKEKYGYDYEFLLPSKEVPEEKLKKFTHKMKDGVLWRKI